MKLLRNIIRHDGELIPLGRLHAMQILLARSPKLKRKPVLADDSWFMRGSRGLHFQPVGTHPTQLMCDPLAEK